MLTAAGIALATGAPVVAAEPRKETLMTLHATGAFDVKITPQDAPDQAAGATLGRMQVEKIFHGDLAATGRGQMLTFGADEVKGSAVYVLIERVTGTLGGRAGGFVLYHVASMDRGQPSMSIRVAPDSGSGELKGLTGELTIRIEPGGAHFYDFAYSLSA